MNLVWLTPAALAMLGLIIGPLLAHLIRQKPQEKRAFGAMMLLQRLPRTIRRRRRIRDWLLLLLRIAVIILVVLTAARPELQWPGLGDVEDGPHSLVVVIDNSMSMNQKMGGIAEPHSIFALARQAVIRQLKELPEGAKIAVVQIGGQAESLTSGLIDDPGEAMALVMEISQSQGGTDLAGGLRLARQLLEGKGGEIYVYTDEAGSIAVDSARDEIALLSTQNAALIPVVLRPENPKNATVVHARYGEGVEGGTVQFRATNFGMEEVEIPCTARLPDGTEITTFAQLPATDSADSFVTVPRVAEGGVGSIHMDDGSLPLDDDFYFHLPRVGASRILVVDGDPGATSVASEVYFLERALAPWGGSNRGGALPDIIGPAGISILNPEMHRVVFLANVAEPAPLAGQMIDFVRDGGGLVISMGNNITADRYNTAFPALLPAALRKPEGLVAYGEQGRPTAIPNLKQELFQPFSRGGLNSFQKIRWSRLFSLEPYKESDTIQTLLRLENGMPLLVERRIGRGRVLLLTGSIDLSWGNLPIQSAFMPLVQRIVSWLGGAASTGGARFDGLVDVPVRIPLPDATEEIFVDGPEGPVPVRMLDGHAVFTPKKSGAYSMATAGAPPLAWIAVNVDPIESDVRPGPSLLETAAEIDPENFLQKAALSPWLLLAALLFAVLQAWLAFPASDDQDDQVQQEDLVKQDDQVKQVKQEEQVNVDS